MSASAKCTSVWFNRYSTPVALPPSTRIWRTGALVMIVTPSALARSAIDSMRRENPPIGYCTPSSRSR
jgi:hypothetical protein